MTPSIVLSRRILWFIVVFFGLGYSFYNISSNINTYNTYPSSLKLVSNISQSPAIRKKLNELQLDNISFLPKITICSNSMHSKSRTERYYADLIPLVPYLYGAPFNATSDEKMRAIDVDMHKFAMKTAPPYRIKRCLYIGEDCRKKWKLIKTIFGYCLQFIPWSPKNSRETIGRQYYVTITFETDQTDVLVGGGWRAFMEGATVYYSSVHEQTQDACYSLNVNDHLVPIISIRRTTRFMLGEPYSTCIKHQHTESLEKGSMYFGSYTKPQCLIDCLLEYIKKTCGCRTFYFPTVRKGKKDVRLCTFHEHAVCAGPIISDFEYKGCHCPECCENEAFETANIHYGRYVSRDVPASQRPQSSFMMYLIEEGDRVMMEQPDYALTQLWSDIGGAAGLMLGISFSSFVGLVDFLTLLLRDFFRLVIRTRSGPMASAVSAESVA